MRVGILGVTGCVGQRFVQMLENHPYFEVLQLFGNNSRGKKYKEVKWILEGEVPEYVKDFEIEDISEISSDLELIFSALPANVAAKLEIELAEIGKIVASNASAHRMKEDIPLIVPEINPEHLSMLNTQKKKRGWKGAILTNPNCSTTILCLALKPILDNFGIERVTAVTMQAVSGAGYPGLPSLDILGNVIPYIEGEEEKIVEETEKIFEKKFDILVNCNRVPTIDGHIENVFVKTDIDFEVEDVLKAFENFSGLPQKRELPTAPQNPILV
ncbi:MAG: aspartate-semialdehyde dehydrogenase, partial [Candidatus Methanofastidiosia archaeon]